MTENELRVADPRNRKLDSWILKFALGATEHIIEKHVKNDDEPWGNALEPGLVQTLKGNKWAAGIDDLKQRLLKLAAQACGRPMALTFQEYQRDPYRVRSQACVACCLLVCRCGLLVALRKIDSDPRIHTAFFRRDTLSVATSRANATAHPNSTCEFWKRPAIRIRECYTIMEQNPCKIAYPTANSVREVPDEENGRTTWRDHIEFYSKHTWAFIDDRGVFRPLGQWPDWREQTS